MKARTVGIIYGFWCVGMLAMTIYGKLATDHGEYGVSAQLLLTLTGMPSSFISWNAPHGSLLGVAIAAIAGCVQWMLVSVLLKLVQRKRDNLT